MGRVQYQQAEKPQKAKENQKHQPQQTKKAKPTNLQVAGQLAVDGQNHQLWHGLPSAAHVVEPLTQAEAGCLNLLLACVWTEVCCQASKGVWR